MKTFETNKTYTIRFIGDCELRPEITVMKRTEKTVTVKGNHFPEKTLRITKSIYDGGEMIAPYGKYSMHPVCRA